MIIDSIAGGRIVFHRDKGELELSPLQKVAVFLMVIGMEKGQGVIALMDNSEIKAIIPEIRKLNAVSESVQGRIRAEFEELGYEDKLNSSETLMIIRFLFNGRKIGGEGAR